MADVCLSSVKSPVKCLKMPENCLKTENGHGKNLYYGPCVTVLPIEAS